MQPSLLVQILSLIGAFCCLFGYVGQQLKWLNTSGITYNLINFIGSGLLAYIAFQPFQAGFFVMEFVWAMVSVYSLYQTIRLLAGVKIS